MKRGEIAYSSAGANGCFAVGMGRPIHGNDSMKVIFCQFKHKLFRKSDLAR